VAELDTLRRQHRQRRRSHLQAGVPTTVGNVAIRQDLLELANYGSVWHLDVDLQRRHDQIIDAGAEILLHQAQLMSLQLLLAEVGETVRFLDRCEAFVAALEQAAMGAFSTARPCIHKTRRPPSAALAEAARLRGLPATGAAAHVVIDLSAYAATAARLDSAPTTDESRKD
jgi:hypothetical protein